MKSKLLIICAVVAIVFAVSGLAQADTIYVATDGNDVTGDGSSGNPYQTIQKGIDEADPCDTVDVAAGTYDEMVNINKSVTLLGANAGVHPAVGTHPTEVVGTRGTETIIKHAWYAFKPTANDITIDGFKFTGEIGGAGQIIRSYVDADNFHLTNCIFDVSREAKSSGWVLFGDGSHNDVLIDFNLFKDEQGHATLYFGGYISPSYDRLHIAYNKFNAGGDGIFWATDTPMADGIVEGNEFDGTIGGTPGQGGTGMNIGKGGNIIIRDNWFHDMWYTGFQVGIVGGSVTDNTFEDTYPILYYSAWYSSNAFELWGGEWGTAVSTNVTISDNTVKFNYRSDPNADEHGIRLRSGADAPNIHINFNNFVDGGVSATALAVRNQGTGIAYAEYNWWGHASGPYHPTTNPTALGGQVSDNVDYDPWLIAPYPPTPMAGFIIDKAKIEFKKDVANIDVKGKLDLDLINGDGVDISEYVTVTVCTPFDILSETIAGGTMTEKDGKWEYKRPKDDGGNIEKMKIDWNKGKFEMKMDKVALTGDPNPVTISIQVGDDLGEQTVTMKEKDGKWEYKPPKPPKPPKP